VQRRARRGPASAVLEGQCPCQKVHAHLVGWLGRSPAHGRVQNHPLAQVKNSTFAGYAGGGLLLHWWQDTGGGAEMNQISILIVMIAGIVAESIILIRARERARVEEEVLDRLVRYAGRRLS
jgi:hypothetical protein